MNINLNITFDIKNINGYTLPDIHNMIYPFGDRLGIWFGMLRFETKKGWVDIYGDNSTNINYKLINLENNEGLKVICNLTNLSYKDFCTKEDEAYKVENPFSIKYLLEDYIPGIIDCDVSQLDMQISLDSYNTYKQQRVLNYLTPGVEIEIEISNIELFESKCDTKYHLLNTEKHKPIIIDVFDKN